MARRVVVLLAAAFAAVAIFSVYAQQPAANDEKAIRQASASFVAAFNKHDAAALAALWAEDGVSVDPDTGERVSGRKAIEATLKKSFADGDKSELQVQIESVRIISPDAAIEEGTSTLVRPGQPPERSTYSAVHVKRKGKWLLSSVHETDLPEPPPPSPYQYLSELAWMIGEWVDQDEKVNARTVCRWTRNGSFMTRSFSIDTGDGEVFDGTEVVGWDPVGHNLRGWVFDSDGGFAHEIWSRNDDTWTITAHAVLPDGRTGTSVRIITKIDDDKVSLKTVSREVDGELLPNIGPVTVVRKSSGN